jgi:predicted nucleic acid-binding protein
VILVDTSVWIQHFRRSKPIDLEALVSFDEVVTCLPVIQEVLHGIGQEAAFRTLRSAMLALPRVESPLPESLVLEAVSLYRGARRAGLRIRSSVDCLVAACALRHDLEVLHHDRDYAALAEVAPLRQRRI